jgi:DNA-binding MarR family transcriptional regulator
MDHAANVVGAGVLAVADRLREATEHAADHGASAPAALAALETYLHGTSIDELRRVLNLTHSGAVRLVDRLEAAGLLRRTRASGDARARELALTPAGRRAAKRVLAQRAAALDAALAPLDGRERELLGELLGRVLGGLTDGHAAAGRICRLCEPGPCGHYDGRCPVSIAAAAAEPAV